MQLLKCYYDQNFYLIFLFSRALDFLQCYLELTKKQNKSLKVNGSQTDVSDWDGSCIVSCVASIPIVTNTIYSVVLYRYFIFIFLQLAICLFSYTTFSFV